MNHLLQQLATMTAQTVKERITDLETDPEVLADKLTKILSHIDSSKLARAIGDLGSADSALDCARRLALELLGLNKEDT